MNIQLTSKLTAKAVKSGGWRSRPWGGFQSLQEKDRFKVRHLLIRPGACLRLQSHFHRAEHWIVVSGAGRVTIDGEVQNIFETESVFIRATQLHQLENHGKVDLHLIEVQTGSYLGDDDIVLHRSPKGS